MQSPRSFIIYLVFAFLPLTRLFRLKALLLRFAGAIIASNVRVASSARFYVGGTFSIGENSWIGEEVLVTGGDAAISIGNNCDIGPRVTIVSGSHRLWETSARAAGAGISQSIRIGDGVWIGAGAIILGGVTIGDCAMIAAGAVVARDVEAETMVAGVPARVIRKRLANNAETSMG
jgi:maltose O-acetyltransferase